MDILIIATLIIAAIILLLVELFLIPGISIAGILAVVCLLSANYIAFAYMGATAGFVTLAVSTAACIGALILFMRSKVLDRVALKKDITSRIDRTAEHRIQVCDTGITTTRLALIGYANIGGHIVEVKSTDGFLDEKTPVKVNRITDGILMVEKITD